MCLWYIADCSSWQLKDMEDAATARAAEDKQSVMRALGIAEVQEGASGASSGVAEAVDLASAAAELKSKHQLTQSELDRTERQMKEAEQEVLSSLPHPSKQAMVIGVLGVQTKQTQ